MVKGVMEEFLRNQIPGLAPRYNFTRPHGVEKYSRAQTEEDIRIKEGPPPAQHYRPVRPENDQPAPFRGRDLIAGAIPAAPQGLNRFGPKRLSMQYDDPT